MWGLVFLRIFFILVCGIAGAALKSVPQFYGILGGLAIGIVVVLIEAMARKVSLKGLTSAVFGICLGLLLAKLFGEALKVFHMDKIIVDNTQYIVSVIFIYLGLTLGLKGESEFNVVIPYVKFKRQELREEAIVVDTSSIIDGRILDIVKTGFLEARFLVARFVLNELQALADSTDHMKRQKGKRGIEMLHLLKKEPNIEVVIFDDEVTAVKTVDEKIIHLGKERDAKVLTTDYNLNRIAQLQGVQVLNINDLANALKPIFVAGERFSLRLVKEGKEHNQSIGYLDDGTMVVVENAKWLIGKTANVEVNSVLQSPSGRIVFAKLVN
ncbi:MAG: PIN domain nuclease [Candidatus Omnitrophica bacterium]|nr:PIN domain nuclease [Candidatus Omnitrophota bacterium]MDD5081121.1 PIN domain nuclease [Candidatus Omnitrophota bacterium]